VGYYSVSDIMGLSYIRLAIVVKSSQVK